MGVPAWPPRLTAFTGFTFMDLTTRCPQCGTIFSASLEQLQLRKGYIRCISCAHIFDGYDAVVAGTGELTPAAGQSPSRPAASAHRSGSGLGAAGVPAPVSAGVAGGAAGGTYAETSGYAAGPAAGDSAVPKVVRQRNRADAAVEQTYTDHQYGTQNDRPAHTVDSHTLVRGGDPVQNPAFTISSHAAAPEREAQRFRVGDVVRTRQPEPVIDYERATVPPDTGRRIEPRATEGFAASATRPVSARGEPHVDESHVAAPSFYMEPKPAGHAPAMQDEPEYYRQGIGIGSLVWRIMVVLGLVLLLAQLVYVYRAQIANNVPLLRPVLEQACGSLGCQVPYARNIEAIAITSSSLSSRAGTAAGNAGSAGSKDANASSGSGGLLLQLAMRNSYGKPQEWPTLVLSLKDVAGTLVVRKNLPPDTYLPAQALSHPFAANSEVTVRVPIMLNGQNINGYQLDKFFQ